MAEVLLIKNNSYEEAIERLLDQIKKPLSQDIKKLKQDGYILLKPSLITAKNKLAVTQKNTIEPIIKFLRHCYNGRIIIGEGTTVGSTQEAFRNYSYNQLVDQYHIELLDLNHDDNLAIEAYDKNLRPFKYSLSKTVLKAPLLISFSPIKTHDSVILSLSLENIINGALIKGNIKNKSTYKNIFKRHFYDYKSLIKQSIISHNLSLATIAQKIKPNYVILDGFHAIERNGPLGGNPINLNFLLASKDPVAADILATHITGFDPEKIGYLHHLNIAEYEVKVTGNKISECRVKLRPHDTFQDQLKWYNKARDK